MANVSSILSRITDMSEQRVDKTLALQLYGKPGVGKTTLAVGLGSYIAEGKSVLYVDTREGWVSLENTPRLLSNVRRIQFQDFGDLGQIALAIKQGKLGDVGCVIIDEFSVACEDLLDELYRTDVGAMPGDVPTSAIDPRLYKPVADAASRVISLFVQQKVHLILVAHEREVVDHRKVKVTRPGYSPTANAGIQRMLHVSAHVTQKVVGKGNSTSYERQVQSHPSDLVDAKSRIGGLPLITDPPTFVQVIHDWIVDPNTGFAEESKVVATDQLPDEGVPLAENADDDEPVMAEM